MKCVIRSNARHDILRQFEYYLIEQDAPLAADRFVEAVEAAIAQVRTNPGIGSPKTTGNPTLAGLRSWPLKGFPEIRIFYLASKSLVRVLRVLHGKRDINPMFEDE